MNWLKAKSHKDATNLFEERPKLGIIVMIGFVVLAILGAPN